MEILTVIFVWVFPEKEIWGGEGEGEYVVGKEPWRALEALMGSEKESKGREERKPGKKGGNESSPPQVLLGHHPPFTLKSIRAAS